MISLKMVVVQLLIQSETNMRNIQTITTLNSVYRAFDIEIHSVHFKGSNQRCNLHFFQFSNKVNLGILKIKL